MELAAMQEGAARLVGQHDFRNFCKMKAAVVHNFVREIVSSTISPVPQCVRPARRLARASVEGGDLTKPLPRAHAGAAARAHSCRCTCGTCVVRPSSTTRCAA
jgi:tRNA U38,U39,U40 pseudouridine synthase TruA